MAINPIGGVSLSATTGMKKAANTTKSDKTFGIIRDKVSTRDPNFALRLYSQEP
jgi:hypothetical protein